MIGREWWSMLRKELLPTNFLRGLQQWVWKALGHSSCYCAVLCFIALHRLLILQREVLWSPCVEQVWWHFSKLLRWSLAIFSNKVYFNLGMCIVRDVVHLIDCSIVQTYFNMHWETTKLVFLLVFALLQWSGTANIIQVCPQMKIILHKMGDLERVFFMYFWCFLHNGEENTDNVYCPNEL